MPRTARIDNPDLLQHVMVLVSRKGISSSMTLNVHHLFSGSDSFSAGRDAELGVVFTVDNFHVLVRPRSEKPTHFMEHLLTGQDTGTGCFLR